MVKIFFLIFYLNFSKLKKNWTDTNLNVDGKKYLDFSIEEKNPNIICAVSGGVDSTVAAVCFIKTS